MASINRLGRISIIMAIAFSLAVPLNTLFFSGNVRSLETGDLVIINSNTEFEEQASLSGWPGDGSSDDPFIIEDLSINGSGHQQCVYIANTTHHFVMRNMDLHGVETASYVPCGLTLSNVSNARIENVTAHDIGDADGIGIWINNCSDIVIVDSLFRDNGGAGGGSGGIYILESSNIDVRDSEFVSNTGTDGTWGIYAQQSEDLSFSGLKIIDSSAIDECHGIYLLEVSETTVRNCTLSNNTATESAGIMMEDSQNIVVNNCELTKNQNDWDSHGIAMKNTNNSTIDGNIFMDQSYGVRMRDSNANRIINNRFENHSFGFFLAYADDNWIENNTIIDSVYGNFGSCPFLYTWNGDEMELIGDVNGMGGIGYSFDMSVHGGGSMERREPTSKDYTIIGSTSLQAVKGNYVLELVEEQDEITYLDEVKLMVLDHPEDVTIYNPEAALCSFEKDLFPLDIHTVKDPLPPLSATDWNGNDILDIVSRKDGIYTQAEILNDNCITLDLGDLSGSEQIKLIYSAYTDWSPIGKLKENVYAEVIGTDGKWQMVSKDEHLGKPEALPRTWVMDISDWFVTDDYRLKLHTGNIKIHVDWIAVDTSTDEPVTVTVLEPTAADHFFKGPIHPTFERFQGDFTRYGDVLQLVEETDDMYVIMKDGDAVRLEFSEQPAPEQGRTFMLFTDAYFKQPFVKHLLGQEVSSVYPLPFHSMSNYPYPPEEFYPDDPEYISYTREWNTRKEEGGIGAGMSLPYSDNNTVIRNTLNGGPDSLLLQLIHETNCSIMENSISGGNSGIYVYDSKNIFISDNHIFNNSRNGISAVKSGYLEIEGNIIADNPGTGINLSRIDNATIFNNHLDNDKNWDVKDIADVHWNVSIREGMNILGGRFVGGNYWNNYTGIDTDGDMLGDTEVPFGPGDHHPLTFEYILPEIDDTTNGTPTTGDPFTFSAFASDLGGIDQVYIEYRFDEGSLMNETMEGADHYTHDVNMPDTVYNVSYIISVIDISGNLNKTDTLSLAVLDNDPPEFSQLSYPDSVGIGETFNISVRITDNMGMGNVTFHVQFPDSTLYINHTREGDLYHADIPVYLYLGAVNISIIAQDTTGNVNSTSLSIGITDNIPPSIDILHPLNNSFVSRTISVVINITDTGSGVDLVIVTVSGLEIYNGIPENDQQLVFSWNTSNFADGEYTMTVSSWDLFGNRADGYINVIVKNNFTEDEELRIISTYPADGALGISPHDPVVEIVFSHPVDTDRISIAADLIPEYRIDWENDDTVMKITFNEDLAYSTEYTIRIDSAYSRLGAMLMDSPFELTFTTMDESADDDDTNDDDEDDATDDDKRDDGLLKVMGSVILLCMGLVMIVILLLAIIIVVAKKIRGRGLEEE